LGEAVGGDREAVEEADAAEQDQPEAVPAFDEPNESFPLAELIGVPVLVMEA
jgi:hypothetical protein